MWNKFKAWLREKLKDLLLREIGGLDQYESILSAFIKQNADPATRSHQIIAFAQDKLTLAVNKMFSKVSLNNFLLGAEKSLLLSQVQSLSQYEAPLTQLIATDLNPDTVAKKIIDAAQTKLVELVNKYI